MASGMMRDVGELNYSQQVGEPARVRTIPMWAGNHRNGWTLTGDGEIVPRVVTWPVEEQFAQMVFTKGTNKLPEPLAKAKGFVEVEGAETPEDVPRLLKERGIKPSRAICEFLIERRAGEITSDMKKEKASYKDIQSALKEFRDLAWTANGFGPGGTALTAPRKEK